MRQREGWLWLASSFLGDLSSSLTWSSASLPLPTLSPGASENPVLQAVASQLGSKGQTGFGSAIWFCIPGYAYPWHECCLRVRVCTLPKANGLVFRCLRGWLTYMLSA